MTPTRQLDNREREVTQWSVSRQPNVIDNNRTTQTGAALGRFYKLFTFNIE